MSSADDSENDIGYAGAVAGYLAAGWRSILPLPPRAKWWPPTIKCPDRRVKRPCQTGCECVYYTGYQAVEPSYPDLMAWSEESPDGNLCLRLPDGVIGIDVDAYGAKTGAAAFAEATRRWGPLPQGPRSSSRVGDLTSGIRLFRVPPGTALETVIAFPELGIGDIEIVQPHHRYAAVWPSIHPEGPRYRWVNEADDPVGLPVVGELPHLPQEWLDGLRIQPRSALSDTEIRYDVRTALTLGEPSPRVQERLVHAIGDLNRPGASRHDVCTRHVMALARMGKTGEPGVEQALRILCDVLIAVRQVDGSDTPEGTRAEFIRMLTNDNIARELSRPGLTDWVSALIVEEFATTPQSPPATPDQPPMDTSPVPPAPQPTDNAGPSLERVQGPDAVTNADTSGSVIVDDSAPRSHLEEIEQGFWQSRESLAMVYQTALARMASPWAVLGICAARALTTVRPNTTLPPVIGGPGSLNLFVALVARSGLGKGAASAAANLLIPKHAFVQRTLGSGEGLVKLFDRPKNAGPDDEINEAILVNVDEVDTLTALSQRSASTTVAVLKQAFSGEALGFSYVKRSDVNDIQDHGYRMTLVVSVQPRKSGGIFADEGGGLPQRFLWLPAGDKRITEDESWPSGPLTLPTPGEWLYPREIAIPPEARRLIRKNRVMNAREELEALDGHALFVREKFAYALAVMEGRVSMTSEDWELSAIAADVSTYAREMCWEQLQDAARLDAVERGAIRGVELEAADVERLEEQVRRSQRVLRWLLHKLDSSEHGFLTQTELAQRVASRDRKALGEILGSGNRMIRADVVDGTVRWFRA